METVSENRRRRGRPEVIDKWEYDLHQSDASTYTKRGLQNLIYRTRALSCLLDKPEYVWLCDGKKMVAGVPNSSKPAILTELGRFEDDDLIKAYAVQICELKPKTAEAVKLLRKARLGRSAKHTHRGLVRALAKTLDNYKIGRGDVAKADILRALNDLYRIVEDLG